MGVSLLQPIMMCTACGLLSIQRNFSRKVSSSSGLLPDCTPYSCHCHRKSHLFFERINFMPSGIWRCFARFVVPDVMRAPLSSKQEITQPVTHCHITAAFNPLQHHCENLTHCNCVVAHTQCSYCLTNSMFSNTSTYLKVSKVPKPYFCTFLYCKWEGGRNGEIKDNRL